MKLLVSKLAAVLRNDLCCAEGEKLFFSSDPKEEITLLSKSDLKQ